MKIFITTHITKKKKKTQETTVVFFLSINFRCVLVGFEIS